MTQTDEARGGCLCGAVQFRVRLPTKWCAHCHCTMCQRAHGAGFVTWVGVPEERFELLAGEAALREYHATPESRRRFCGRCGASLFFDAARWPGEIHIARANFATPIDREPDGDVFTESRVDWLPH